MCESKSCVVCSNEFSALGHYTDKILRKIMLVSHSKHNTSPLKKAINAVYGNNRS